MKICSKCKAEKPLTEFHKDSKSKALVYSQCKSCVSNRNADRYALSAEKNRARSSEYKKINPDSSRETTAKWRERNRERTALYNREWRINNIDRALASCAEWRKRNKDKIIASNRSRKASEIGAKGRHSADDVREIISSQNSLCANCLDPLKMSGKNKYHVDHIMPLSLGGSNDRYNLQCLCPACNLRKHAKDPITWANENGRLL